ncbi:2-dehydro-3-deoxy-phosphogluconate aldolase [Oceanobacillus kimchii]
MDEMAHNFYNGRICLNVLAADITNAKEIYEATDGHVLIGLLSSNYNSVHEALEDIKVYDKELDGAISLGLGGGNPEQWKMVADISREYQPRHINQVFPKVGYTRATVNHSQTMINSLVKPTGRPGFVDIATGPTNKDPIIVEVEAAIQLSKEMGGNSLKFFPMGGTSRLEEYEAVAEACAREGFYLEPTGGIDVQNSSQIMEIALRAGVKKVIPHVYSSIIDASTGRTKLEDVQSIYHFVKQLGDQYGE